MLHSLREKLTFPLTITITLSLFAIFSPFIFTRYGRASWPNFTDTGQIGDTIGGLTAPVIGLLNAILLYLTLKRQDELNGRTIEEIKKNDRRYYNDKAERGIENQVTLIRDRTKQISLFLRKVSNNHEGESKKKEVYEGLTALHMYVMLTRENSPLAHRYSVRNTSGVKFIEDVNALMFHASTGLTTNITSDLPLPVKMINYNYIKSHIHWVEKIYQNALIFKAKQSNELSAKFFIDEIILLGGIIDFIATLNPDTASN